MAEILSFQDARRAASLAADRAEALSYVERMTAFHAEMQRLTECFDILGHAGTPDDGLTEAEILYHPALLRA